jgi:hypothetical protein
MYCSASVMCSHALDISISVAVQSLLRPKKPSWKFAPSFIPCRVGGKEDAEEEELEVKEEVEGARYEVVWTI